MNTEILDALKDFKNKTILIIGDIILDSYLIGTVERISPEAPVAIVDLFKKEDLLGGAANVALNIKSLGATAHLIGIIGKDEESEKLKNCLKKNNISVDNLTEIPDRKTTVKTRIIGNNNQLLRIDSEDKLEIKDYYEELVMDKIITCINTYKIDAVILEDYNKGLLTSNIIKDTIALCNKKEIPTFVDPKKNNFWAYNNATVFKPNWKESINALELDHIEKTEANAIIIGNTLIQKLEIEHCLITLAEKGLFIMSDKKHNLYPTKTKQVLDVSGAGDTVIAISCLSFVSNLSWENNCLLSNIAAGIVCNKAGVNPIKLEELTIAVETLK